MATDPYKSWNSNKPISTTAGWVDPNYVRPSMSQIGNSILGGVMQSASELPLDIAEYGLKGLGYIKGQLAGKDTFPFAPDPPPKGAVPMGQELRSNPIDKIRAERFAQEEFRKNSEQGNPNLQNAGQLGYMSGYAFDPIMDTAGAMAPLVAKGLKTLPETGKLVGKIIDEERGNLGAMTRWSKSLENKGGIVPPEMKELADKYMGNVDLFPKHTGGSPLRTNMDYGKSFDLDTECPRNANRDDIVSRASAMLKRPLTSDESFAATQFLHEKGVKAPCVHCYVDTPRRSWLDGKLDLSVKEGIDPRVWTDGEFLKQSMLQDPMLGDKMANIARKSRPMMASTPKGYAEYSGQFLRMPEQMVEKYNSRAGFRMNSSTDFKPWQTLDFAQSITDANLKGLQLHAYTKEPDFIELIGDTGVKINMSTAATGGMKDGKVDFDSIVPDVGSGMDWDQAKKFQGKYKDVGIVFNAANQGQLEWALQQPWIQYIIPYHASGQKAEQFAKFGAEDFTRIQNASYRDGRTIMNKKGKEVPDRPKLTRAEHGNDSATLREYNDKYGIDPQFAPYQDDPNHMKLVVDYARHDTPHEIPDPSKINWKKANELMEKYVKLGDKTGDVSGDMVKEFANRIKKQGNIKSETPYTKLSERLDRLSK